MEGVKTSVQGVRTFSECKFREIVECFATDPNAVQTSELNGLNRNIVNCYLRKFRERIAEYCEALKVRSKWTKATLVPGECVMSEAGVPAKKR
jgi:transposase